MGFEMVARLSCEANHQNSCITKHICITAIRPFRSLRGNAMPPHHEPPLWWFSLYGGGENSQSGDGEREGVSNFAKKRGFGGGVGLFF